MSITGAFPQGSNDDNGLLPAVPEASFAAIASDALRLPEGLFDEKAGLSHESAIDDIMPLVVAKDLSGGSYVVIDGCKRLFIGRKNRKKKFSCAVFPRPLDPKTAGLLRIMLNKERPKSLRENILFLRWLGENAAPDRPEDLAEALGFPSSLRIELKPLLACTGEVIDAVAAGGLTYDVSRIFV